VARIDHYSAQGVYVCSRLELEFCFASEERDLKTALFLLFYALKA
jgi:hypothetical protein